MQTAGLLHIVGMGYYPLDCPGAGYTLYEKHSSRNFPYIQNEVPDLIVCNLGTNDASYVRQIPSRERAFVEKYTDFIQQLKKVFADAKMLLLYGLMEQTLCEKVQETAQRCGTEFLKLPLQNPVNGMGTDGHPGARTQQEIALYVERYMEQMMMWRTDER